MEKREALNEAELEQVTGGYRGRGGDLSTCPYCGQRFSAYDLNNHIYSAHTAPGYTGAPGESSSD